MPDRPAVSIRLASGGISMFVGQKFVMRSPLSREEMKQRINQAAGSVFNPIGGGIRGKVLLNRLWLDHSGDMGWLFAYNAAPRLTGRLHDVLGSTEIHARFGPPRWIMPFFVIWYGLLSLMMISLSLAALSGRSGNWEAIPFALVVIPVFFVLPIAMHVIFTRDSAAKLGHIMAFLEQEAQATRIVDGHP
ncbi:MAG: hypothetical protein EOP86_27150 [Verrucomicrobiaceae bacterium]|nr:MAG: hypothetical protein EOP86_27150 [Verrucomicrobiaceae bacterium]